MADRRRQVILLLGSRFDGLYLPPGSLVTPAGLVPAEREPCTSCGGILLRDDFGKEIKRRKGRGYILDRFQRRQPCTHCGEVGWIARDPMDSLGVRVGSTTTTSTSRPRATVRCDACDGDGVRRGERCGRCDGTGRRDLHVFDLHVETRDVDERDPLAQAIEARNESGSYAELERALAGVAHHVNKPLLHRWITDHAARALRLLDELYLPPANRSEDELTVQELALVTHTLAYIAQRMPDPIEVPAQVTANARELAAHRGRVKGRHVNGDGGPAVERRNSEIRKLIRAGKPTQWIAAEYGLSVRRVNQIYSGDSE